MRFAVETSDRFAVIAFDDGGMNLLSSAALEELRDIVRRIRDVDLLLFRSARPDLFAAGADMAEMRRFGPPEAARFAALGQETFAAIERLPCATAAFIDGDCFGGALDLVLAFDVRLATPRSRFSHPGARLGIVTGFGGTSRWRTSIDRAAARRLFLGNPVLTAAQARDSGLVDAVVSDPGPELARLRSLDPARTRLVKELAAHAGRLSRRELALVAERLGSLYGVVE